MNDKTKSSMTLFKLTNEKGFQYFVLANHPTEAVEKFQKASDKALYAILNVIKIEAIAKEPKSTDGLFPAGGLLL